MSATTFDALSAWASPGALPGSADPRAQRGHSNGISLVTHPRLLGRRRQPGVTMLGLETEYGSTHPPVFMELQEVQGLSNFFERRV